MEAQVIQSDARPRRMAIPAVRWGAVFAGTISGIASYMLLGLFGIAVGLTAVGPGAGNSTAVPVATGIWTGISMLVSAFIGGYVASRMSGLARRSDGMLHGFIAWGATMVIFAWLATTAIGSLLGGTFSLLGKGMQGAGQAAQSPGITQQLGSLISGGNGNANISPQNLSQLRSYLSAGDRNGAVQYMTSQMGFTQDRANQVVDQMMPLFSGQTSNQAQQTLRGAVNGLTAASWWLFVAILLALILGIWGGLVGARATSDRTLGDHSDERHYRTY